jgi:hypothetical protein
MQSAQNRFCILQRTRPTPFRLDSSSRNQSIRGSRIGQDASDGAGARFNAFGLDDVVSLSKQHGEVFESGSQLRRIRSKNPLLNRERKEKELPRLLERSPLYQGRCKPG